MLIEIKGVQFVNKGAELMLHAVLEQVGERYPNADIVLGPGVNSSYSDRAKTGALQKVQLRRRGLDLNGFSTWVPKRLRAYLRRTYGLVFECDIDLVLDAMGFAYGDAWDPTISRLTAGEVKRAQKRHATYIFLPQAFGPFTQAAHSKPMAAAFSRATLICARDNESYKYVKALCDRESALKLFPDFTNLLKASTPDSFAECYTGRKPVLIIPNNNMLNARNSEHGAWEDTYLRLLTRIAALALTNDMVPVILNHEGQADQLICEQLQAEIDRELNYKVDILRYSSPLDVKGAIGAAELVVCSRYHGCVSALSQGVPCMGTSWSHKYEALFADYVREQYLLSPEITDTLLNELFDSVLNSTSTEEYMNAITSQVDQAKAMWQEVENRVG